MTAIRRGWLHLASGAGLGRAFGFVGNLLLSRWLGPTELGLFNLVMTTVQTSETLVRCGGDFALNFELGAEPDATKTERGVDLAHALAQLCSLTTALTCVGVAIWVWLGHGLFPISLLPGSRFILTGLLLLMIACEGISAAAWEVLLVSHRTAPLALRQGLFSPLRLIFAAVGALFGGVWGAMGGWSFIALVQCVWLKIILGHLWRPLQITPFLRVRVSHLLRLGFPFYASNLLASIIFYPLLLSVAAGSGLSEIGYLRVGQILQQLFAFLPATLVPLLFLKLRAEQTFAEKVSLVEIPIRVVWLFLLEALLAYCIVDRYLIVWFFGPQFTSAILPTRLLLITSLFESLTQLVVQPLLAAGNTRIYDLLQNGSAIVAAIIGWTWIPGSGLAAYLIVRLIYVLIPFIDFCIPLFQNLNERTKALPLVFLSFATLLSLLSQVFDTISPDWMPIVYMFMLTSALILQREDFSFLGRLLGRQT